MVAVHGTRAIVLHLDHLRPVWTTHHLPPIGTSHHLTTTCHHGAAIGSDALLADEHVVCRPPVAVARMKSRVAHSTEDALVVKEAKVFGSNDHVGGSDGPVAARADALLSHVVGLADERAIIGVQ